MKDINFYIDFCPNIGPEGKSQKMLFLISLLDQVLAHLLIKSECDVIYLNKLNIILRTSKQMSGYEKQNVKKHSRNCSITFKPSGITNKQKNQSHFVGFQKIIMLSNILLAIFCTQFVGVSI